MHSFTRFHCFAACLVLATSAAHANLIANGSFETASPGVSQPGSSGTSLQPGTASATYIANWTAVAPNANSGVNIAWLAGGNFGLDAQQGNDFIDLTGYTDSSPYGGIAQVVTGLTVNGAYKLTFYVGVSVSDPRYVGPVSVKVSSASPSDVVYTTQTFTTGPGTATPWTAFEYDFTALTSSVVIRFDGGSSTGGQYIGLDNADLELYDVVVPPSGTVPEPAMLGLFGLGITGLALTRRRKAR